MIHLTLILLAGLLCLAAPAEAVADTARLKMSGGHFVTHAEINGSRIRVLVDTGATAVALSHRDAAKAGFRPEDLDFDVPVSTANGIVKAARVTIERIEVGSILVEDIDGMVLPKGALSGSLLGMSFLSRLDSFEVKDGVLHLRN